MKQIQLTFRDDKTFEEELQKLQHWVKSNLFSKVLIQIFTEILDHSRIDHITERIEQALPEALYAGCSSNGNIVNGDFSGGTFAVICTLIEYPSTKVELLQYPMYPDTQAGIAERLADEVDKRPWVKAVELLGTIRGMSMTPFCEGLSRIRKDVQIFGGGAFCKDRAKDDACVFSKAGGYQEKGVVFILFGGDDFHAECSFVTGWKPLSSFMDVTATDGNILKELNHRPAYDLYYKYLHIRNDENFFHNTLEFPFIYRYHGIDIMRAPMASTPDGCLIMTSDMAQNIRARIAYGDPWTVLDTVWQEGNRILQFSPECIFVFSCAARRAYWGDKEVGKETEPYQMVAPTSGFFTSGEFLRTGGYVNQHNVTQVIAAMREGDAKERPEKELRMAELPVEGKLSMISRMATFIKATTEELEKLISATEYDELTGLYNQSFFYEFANRFYREQPDKPADAIVVNINQFHSVNELHGRDFGDKVLRTLGMEIRAFLDKAKGIGSRLNVDDYYIFCTPQEDYQVLLDRFQAAVNRLSENAGIRLRMGVMPWKKGMEPVQLLDRAHTACRRVRYSDKRFVVYDEDMLEREHLNERLLNDLVRALREHEFKVYYQPKFNIKVDPPVLCSAEALVRWQHPELGQLDPGKFIPLFEENGLIQQVDRYVWREVASQMAAWLEKYGRVFPVSVNVSRIDLYDPDFGKDICDLLKELSLRREDFLLEITESAYTEDSEQIVENVKKLRKAGFLIEMDDFGSGYSSLNMISTLPIDIIKLDMQFIRNAFKGRSDTRMLEAVLGIAAMLYLPTVAEGVETVEQLKALRSMGCDAAQGYYFSKPVPAEEYESFIEQRLSLPEDIAPIERSHHLPHLSDEDNSYDQLHDPLTGLYNYSAFHMLVKDADQYSTALLLAEVVEGKQILAEQGQITAELVIRHVADLLRSSFRPVDHICRVSNAGFAIIMSQVDSGMQEQVAKKIGHINELLGKTDDKTPAVSLAVGVAFADRPNPGVSILEDAKTALNGLKEQRKSGYSFYFG